MAVVHIIVKVQKVINRWFIFISPNSCKSFTELLGIFFFFFITKENIKYIILLLYYMQVYGIYIIYSNILYFKISFSF